MKMIEHKTIWKYEVGTEDRIRVSMPEGAQILKVANQREEDTTFCIWALVNPNNEPETRTFRVYGTGHKIIMDYDPKNKQTYIGSYFLKKGNLVFHVFEQTEG